MTPAEVFPAAPKRSVRLPSADHVINPPQQRRSQESLERMLRVGLDLLREVGLDGFTLQELSRRANISIGAIYLRVPSREALLLTIHERVMTDLEADVEQISRDLNVEDLNPRELVERLVSDLANAMLGRRETLRVFMRDAPFNQEIWQRGSEHAMKAATIFADALLARCDCDQLAHSQPQLAVDMAFRMLYCTIARRITFGEAFESSRPVTDREMIAELTRAVASYLLQGN